MSKVQLFQYVNTSVLSLKIALHAKIFSIIFSVDLQNKKMFVGVDIGSSSCRAGLFDYHASKLLKKSVRSIKIWKEKGDVFEQSSNDIFEAVCECVKDVSEGFDVQGIAFDATCSLVILSKDNLQPLSERNIIMWCDHRAKDETSLINSKEDEVLKFVGGKMSIEMEIPKILWIKRNKPETYEKAIFFDLADFLLFACTGKDIRSVTTNACKWGYLSHSKSWNKSFFEHLDLSELLQSFSFDIKEPGTRAGKLKEEVATRMGLKNEINVSVGIIDAHAGGFAIL